jgi:predicted esterase
MFSEDITRFLPMADKFGMIIVTLTNDWAEGSGWEEIRYRGRISVMDSALHSVLSHYAIDPDKIALMGLSGGGDLSMIIGCRNLDVFSQLGLMSPIPGDEYDACDVTHRPPAARTPIFLTMGIGEPSEVLADALRTAPQARKDGHPVQLTLDLRPHRGRLRDSGNVLQWLADKWASPRRVPKPAPLESVVPLTTDILTKMTSFWESYRDSHPKFAREIFEDVWPAVHVKPVRIPIARDTATVFDMLDLRTIADKDSSVNASLEAAGLTFAQEHSYRAAFIGARATLVASYKGPELGAIPAVEHNVAFLKKNLDAGNALLDLMMGEIRCETGAQERMIPGSCE